MKECPKFFKKPNKGLRIVFNNMASKIKYKSYTVIPGSCHSFTDSNTNWSVVKQPRLKWIDFRQNFS